MHDVQKYLAKLTRVEPYVLGPIDSEKNVIKFELQVNVNEQMPKKSLAPMTKEQYDEKQSVVRKVFDEDTGRMRLVKGDGEIIEEIVSASRQKEINKAATLGDGNSFQANISSILHKN